MKNLLFDLDGTLWKTDKGYIYGYHKLIEKYHIENPFSDDEILSCLGLDLDKVFSRVFSFMDSKEVLKDAAHYVVEYVLAHPEESKLPMVKETLITLSKKYQLYIVSNCPSIFVETFIKINGLEELNIKSYTAENGKKADIVKSLIKEKSIFVGDSHNDYEAIDNHYNCTFVYAKYGYDAASEYDYSICSFDELSFVIETIETKDEMLTGKEYRSFSSNDSNITLIKNKNGTYYFGFVNFQDNEDDTIAINRLKEEIKRLKISVTGPINGNTFYPYRFACNHFDWKLYPDCNNSEETYNLFLKNGFKEKQKYVSTLATINQKIWDKSKKIHLGSDYKIVVTSGEDAYKYIDDLYSVAVDAFTRGDYYEEINKEDFVNIYMKSLSMVSPDLVLVYHKDQLVGFDFCYEDPEKRFYVCKTIGIKKEYQKKLIVFPLGDHSFQTMVKRGYKEILYHFQNDRTKVLDAIYHGCIIKQKYYTLLEYSYEK